MKKPIKIVLGSLAGLVVLLVAAVAVLVTVVDPNDYKAQIAELVEKNTGFRVQFNGPLELKVFPRLGVGAKNVLVLPQAAFGDAELLALDEASLRMALLPLLSGNIEVDSLLVSGAKISLHTNKQGQNNWDMPTAASGQNAAAAAGPDSASGAETVETEQAAASDTTSAASGFKAEIAAVRVEKCVLNYQNDQTGQNIALDLNELDLQNIALGRDVDLILDAAYADKAAGMNAGIRLEGTAMFDLEKQFLRLNLPAVTASLNSPQLAAPQTFNGSLSAEGALQDFSGKLALAFGNAELDFKLDATSNGLPAGAAAGALPSLNAKFNLKSNPAKLLAALGIKLDTASPQALNSLNLDADISLSENNQNELLVSGLKGALDSTSIQGAISAKLPGATGLPAGVDYVAAVDLQLGELDADAYLPPADKNSPAATRSGAGQEATTATSGNTPAKGLLKDTPLEKTVLDINFELAALTIQKLPVRDVQAIINANRGTVELKSFSLNTLQGSISARGKAGLLQAKPPVSLSASIKGLDLEQALSTLANFSKLSGKLNLDTSLSFTGLDQPSIFKTLGGNGKFNIAQSNLHDFQLIPADAPELILKYRQPDYPFENISGSFTASNGVISNNDLQLVSPKLSVKGAGKVSLAGNNLDYKATVFLPDNITLPLIIGGSLDNPSYGPDFEAIGKAAAKGVVEQLQQSGKLPQLPTGTDAQKKLEEGVGSFLKGIRGN